MSWPVPRVFRPGGGNRPAPVRQRPLPPFDTTDAAGNQVHTVLPPEKSIPDHFTDPVFMRADFNGVTLEGHFEHENQGNLQAQANAIIAAGGTHITTGRWAGLWIPFIPGANTTPPTMLMTPMLYLYPADVQQAHLTEQAERAYDDFIWDCVPWNGQVMTVQQALDWCAFLRSWGFRPVLWRGNPNFANPVDDMLRQLVDSGAISFYVHGEEVDSKTNKETYEAGLDQVNAFVNRRIPIGAHFTAEPMPPAGRGMGYPNGFPRDTFILDWSKYDGAVHLCLQLNVEGSAGLQGAGTWYARRRLMGIGDGAKGPGAPNSRVINFETMAFKQLLGGCSEEYGCLRNWEAGCGPRDDTRSPAGLLIPPPSGFGNGNRYPNGDPL